MDVPTAMDDGVVLRADVYRPTAAGTYPVIASYGPYAKGQTSAAGYAQAWKALTEGHPDAIAGPVHPRSRGRRSPRRG
jgi:predicted acyl esterase